MKALLKRGSFAALLLLLILAIASCGGVGDPETTTAPVTTAPPTTTTPPTTTAPPTTTTPPTTTAPPVTTMPPTTTAPTPTTVHPLLAQATIISMNAEYRGSAIARVATVTNMGQGASNKFSFALTYLAIDPTSGEALPGATPVEQPVDAGTYLATATFTFKNAATNDDKAYALPTLTARVVVTPLTIENPAFGAKDAESYHLAGENLDIATLEDIRSGVLPEGLVPQFSIEKVDNADGDNPVAHQGTVLTDPGFYKVTITYGEPAGKNNITNEGTFTHTAIFNYKEVPANRRVLKVDGVTIDGVLDDAYKASACITSVRQEGGSAPIVNPNENIGMDNIYTAESVPANLEYPLVTVYTLWGEEGEGADKTPYLYVAIQVNDTTLFSMPEAYTAQPNGWVNDAVEFAYSLGGTTVPVIPSRQDTYPTYNFMTVEARDRAVGNAGDGTAGTTTIDAGKSLYFDDIMVAAKRTSTEYVIEMKIPAKSETVTDGNSGLERAEGADLTAGEFVFFMVQIDDLTGQPTGFDFTDVPSGPKYIPGSDYAYSPKQSGDTYSWSEYENAVMPYIRCIGNRSAAYQGKSGAGPIMFQLTNETYEVNIDETDGVKDADYTSKGTTLTYTPTDAEAEPITGATPYGNVETVYVNDNGTVYIYTTATAAGSVEYTVGDKEFTVTADGTLAEAVDGVTVTPLAAGDGKVHEIKVTGVTKTDTVTTFVTIGSTYQRGE